MTYSMTAVDIKNVILTSDDCDSASPDKPDTNVDFTTTQQEGQIVLHGKWKVNMSELFVSGNIKNINKPMGLEVKLISLINSTSYNSNHVVKLPAGVYSTMGELIEKIYELFDGVFIRNLSLRDILVIDFIQQKNKVTFQKRRSNNSDVQYVSVEIGVIYGELNHILGFGPIPSLILTDTQVHELPYVADLYRGINKLYIMTNIIDLQYVGKIKASVLRTIPIDYEKLNKTRLLQYSGDPMWCTIETNSQGHLPAIRIMLCEDPEGHYISLEDGSSVTVTLQFVRYG